MQDAKHIFLVACGLMITSCRGTSVNVLRKARANFYAETSQEVLGRGPSCQIMSKLVL